MTEHDDPIVGKIIRAVPFPVDVECNGYPDVIFHIIFQRRPEPSEADQAAIALDNYAQAYNRLHFLRPIHYVSEPNNSFSQNASVFSACIHMDFGNANPNALLGAVKAIAATRLPIFRLILE